MGGVNSVVALDSSHHFVHQAVTDSLTGFSLLFTFFQAILILLFGLFTEYAPSISAIPTDDVPLTDPMQEVYPLFQDVHVMIFVGFGFLMTFLRKYSYGAVGFTFMIGVFCIQWGILNIGFWDCVIEGEFKYIALEITRFVNADFCAGAVLISFGAVIGRVTPSQCLVMAFCEVIVYALHQSVEVFQIGLADLGGTYIIHMFGAYFGLAVSTVLSRKRVTRGNMDDNAPSYHSDVFAMIGTLFLWLYWPSFNGALAGNVANSRHRSIINTLLSITCSTMVAFLTSRFFRRTLNMVDIQNATLAGGVAMGACANMLVQPFGAMLIGCVAGFISTVGYVKLQEVLARRLGILDTCGVHNLHGMPSLVGALASVIAAAAHTHADYGGDVGYTSVFRLGVDRSPSQQALWQLAAIPITLGFALVGGVLCGLVLAAMSSPSMLFSDVLFWEVPHAEPLLPSQVHPTSPRLSVASNGSNQVRFATVRPL